MKKETMKSNGINLETEGKQRGTLASTIKKIIAVTLALLLLQSFASAIIHPMNEEAIEAFFRQKTAENYWLLVKDRLDTMKGINNLILENPPLYEPSTRNLNNFFTMILQPLYITLIVMIGIYLLFSSGSPTARSKAKMSLLISLFAIALITVSPHILMMFFNLSKALTLNVLSMAPLDTDEPFNHAINGILNEGSYIISHRGEGSEFSSGVERGGIPLLFMAYASLESVLLMLKLRFYIVTILSIIFPLTITFYAFLPTRGIGRLLVEQTILWTLSQVAMALVLIVVAIGADLTGIISSFTVSSGLKIIMETSGLILLIITPVFFVRLFGGFFRQ